MTAVTNPKYEALWPPYHRFPFEQDEPQTPRLVRERDARFDAWAPAPGNATPSWTYVSTPAVNSGKFSVAPGGWFDPGDHPNPEVYYILKGTLHLSNPDISDVVELQAGDAALIPAWAFHHGYNFANEEVVIYWWVPGEMHTDLFKQKVEHDTLYDLGWYERKPVVLNGPHSSNPGFDSRVDTLAKWPVELPVGNMDMVRLGRERWLKFIQGSEPRQAALVSFFYADDAIRCGHVRLNGFRDTQPEVSPWEKLLYVTEGELCVKITGTPDVLKGEPGDVIFVPPGVEHSYLTTTPTGAEAVFGLARPIAA
jgi:quercetin dioxygenase-like cupin family protein